MSLVLSRQEHHNSTVEQPRIATRCFCSAPRPASLLSSRSNYGLSVLKSHRPSTGFTLPPIMEAQSRLSPVVMNDLHYQANSPPPTSRCLGSREKSYNELCEPMCRRNTKVHHRPRPYSYCDGIKIQEPLLDEGEYILLQVYWEVDLSLEHNICTLGYTSLCTGPQEGFSLICTCVRFKWVTRL